MASAESKIATYRVFEWFWFIVSLVFAPVALTIELHMIVSGAAIWNILLMAPFALFLVLVFLNSIGFTTVTYNRETQEVRITETSFALGYRDTWNLQRDDIAKVAVVLEETLSVAKSVSVEILLRNRKKSVAISSGFPLGAKRRARRLAEILGVEVDLGLHRGSRADWSLDADETSWFWGLLVRKKKAKRSKKRGKPAFAKKETRKESEMSWPLDSEDELVRNLSRLLTEGGNENFLIVSAGDVYLQFAASPGNKEVYCEAVSNENLPADLHLTVQKVMALNQLGFEDTGDLPNFSRNFDVSGEQDILELARLARSVLSDIYGCPAETKLKFELNLG